MKNPFSRTYNEDELKMFEFLSEIKLFSSLKHSEMAKFLTTIHHRKYSRDEVIFFRSDPSHALYILKSGIVNLTLDIKENFELIKTVKKNQSFGENSLLENTKRVYTSIVATDEADVIVIPNFAIQEIFDSNPKIKAKMMTALAEYYNENNIRLFKSYKTSFGFFDLREMFEEQEH